MRSAASPDLIPPAFAERFRPFVLGFQAAGLPESTLFSAVTSVMTKRGFTSFDELMQSGDLPDVWAEATATLPPFATLLAGAAVPLGAFAVVDYLAASCASMAEGIERLGRYLRIIRNGISFDIQVTTTDARIDFIDERAGDTFFDEWTTGVTVQRFRDSTRIPFDVREARFRSSPCNPDMGKARAFLGCDPVLGAKVGGFSVPIDAWRAPLILSNEPMRQSLEAHAERLLQESSAGTSEMRLRVRKAAMDELRGGDPSIQFVAKKLKVTPRTLQRRLSDEGASYQTVLDELRADLADRYLETEGLSVTEVAFLLGYAEASSFARAYRRWKGTSPIQTRRQSETRKSAQ
ncbi:MAG: helix-turn-helix domain-containing protein [Polyangiaceae bacterium]|nr:helix-turn-helix domain-containing protein [Polyangiaceae bacterium]